MDTIKNFLQNQETILHLAAKTEQIEVLDFILNHIQLIDVDDVDKDGKTALHISAIKGNFQAVQLLLDFGADPRLRDKVNRTATHWAAESDHHEVVLLLLESGSTGFEKDTDGKCPIHIATSRGHLKVVQSLINFNCDIASVIDNVSFLQVSEQLLNSIDIYRGREQLFTLQRQMGKKK